MSVTANDFALPNGGNANPASADPGGMTNEEKQSVGGLLRRDEARGAAVHAFDPDATPEQKAAAAGQARAALAPVGEAAERLKARVKGKGELEEGRTVIVDTSSAKAPTPTVSLQQIDQTSRGEGQGLDTASIPGAIPTGTAPPVPTWLLTGWRQVANRHLIMAGGDPKIAEQQSILAEYVSEQAYGSWYHNAGIILFAVLSTRFITTIRLGWGWVILILVACASYYTLSIRRTRERARDDMQRELVKTRLVTETESADWMNSFLERFWLIYEPILSQTIVASVDNVLAANTPGFLESIRMTTFTLGTKAPRIDYIRTFPKTPDDVVIMDWALSFTPSDVMDITKRQALAQVNPKIVLSIRVGKGMVSKALPILLEDINFTGKMRIKLQLMTNFPHVKTVEISFIEKPTFDYVLKPIGGETLGFDINNIPGLAPFIRDQVHANLGPMMYDPNVFTIDLQALLSGNPLDSAIGVLKVYIRGARSLKAVKIGGGAPDPYVSFALGSKPSIGKTQTINSTSNPSFQETHFILINSLADLLSFSVFDYNEHRPDNLLGTVTQELAPLADDAEQESIVSRVIHGGKDRGELRYDLSYFPVLQPTKNPDGTIEPPPESQTGIVRFFIHQGKDLDIARQHGDLNPFVKMYLGGNKTEVHRTQIMKHAPQPIWESHTEFLVPEKNNSVITLQVINGKDFAPDPSLGHLTVKLSDLLEAGSRQQDWFPLQNSRAGKIRLSAIWKPVAMTGALDGASTYTPPIGIMRIHLKKAVDVKNVEAALGGKSDPYVRIMGANKTLARTEVIQNSLNPEWDQIVYVPVHHLKISYLLELMDYQNIGKDRSLGIVDLKLSDYIEETGDQAYPYRSKGPKTLAEKIRLDKANHYKGTLHFEIDFKPAMALRGGVSFEAKQNELEIAAQQQADSDTSSLSSSDEERIGHRINHGKKNGIVNDNTAIAPAAPVTPQRHARKLSEQFSMPTSANGKGHRGMPSIDKASIAPSVATANETEVERQRGVVMSQNDLLSHQSGILVFQVISGQLARKGSLEVMFDDGYWPAFTSGKARSTHAAWDQVGEGFVKELDFSRIWLRINANDSSNEKDDIVAEFKCDTKDFLEQCFNEPADFLLSQADGSNRSTIRMTARYVPVSITLEPRESINNMGILRVEVIGAKNLMAGDRSGKSDPYVTFNLNGTRVFKSETKKKTLSPIWNENFEAMIPSRVGAKFNFEVQDWNTVGSSTDLGGGQIDLASLEPFEAQEMTIPIIHAEKGEKGHLDIRLLFQPEIIARSRHKTSTFSTAGRVITTVGAVPMGVGKGAIKGGAFVAGHAIHGGGAVVGGVGHGIGTVGGFAGRKIGLIKKKDKSGKEVLVQADADPDDPSAVSMAQAHLQAQGLSGDGPQGPGMLLVSVVSGSGLVTKEGHGVKPYVIIKAGGKSHKTGHGKGVEPEWNETLSFGIGPETSSFNLTVLEKHNFGKDIEIGEADVEIWQHIQPAMPTADVTLELSGGAGVIRLRLDWTTGSSHGSVRELKHRASSIRSSTESPASPSRFSLKRHKTKDKE